MKVKDYGLSFIHTEANAGERVIHNDHPLMQDCHSTSISIKYRLNLPIMALQQSHLSLI